MAGMIVAPEPVAVEAGARVLMAGGNAIDAAVTCAFVQMIVNPQMCGIGGYALAVVRLAGEPTTHTILLMLRRWLARGFVLICGLTDSSA